MKVPHFHILSLSVKSFSTSVKACHQNEHHFIQHSSSFRMSCIVDHKMFYIVSACNRILNYLKKVYVHKTSTTSKQNEEINNNVLETPW